MKATISSNVSALRASFLVANHIAKAKKPFIIGEELILPATKDICCELLGEEWHPTPVLLPGKSHGWRNLVGCSPWGCWESDTTERLHFYFSLSCIGEGNGNPLQCSCLENPRDRGAWWAAISGVAQSQTRLKRLSSSSSPKVEKAMASHSSTLAWKIPRTEEPGRLQSMGSDTTEGLHFHFSLSCIGEANGNPLQCSCLENPRDGGAWWAAIYGVAQHRTRLKLLSSSSPKGGLFTSFS